MSRTLRRCFKVLEVISTIKPKKLRDAILKDFSKNPDIFDSVSEISVNAIKGKVKPKEPPQKVRLRRYKRLMIDIALKPKAKTSRKKLLVQSGGFLPLLIPAVAELLAKILFKKKEKEEE